MKKEELVVDLVEFKEEEDGVRVVILKVDGARPKVVAAVFSRKKGKRERGKRGRERKKKKGKKERKRKEKEKE